MRITLTDVQPGTGAAEALEAAAVALRAVAEADARDPSWQQLDVQFTVPVQPAIEKDPTP